MVLVYNVLLDAKYVLALLTLIAVNANLDTLKTLLIMFALNVQIIVKNALLQLHAPKLVMDIMLMLELLLNALLMAIVLLVQMLHLQLAFVMNYIILKEPQSVIIAQQVVKSVLEIL